MMADKPRRQPEHEVEPLIVERWSPRAMSGEALSDAELGQLFEAARWAPSSFNEQPWRILYARRDSAEWETFFGLLVEANQVWAREAAVLLVIVSKSTFTRNGKPNPVHVYDAGAAWENLALQGARMGLVVHGMAGFDNEAARERLSVPADYTVVAMAAVGRPGDVEKLPEKLREMEFPSDRRPIGEWTAAGGFPGAWG